MEKVIDMLISSGVIIGKPLHSKQFAYYAGKSTKTILDNLVSKIREQSWHAHTGKEST